MRSSLGLAALFACSLALGCTAITNPDRFHRADGGGADAQELPDAGPCDTPVDEVCNGEDDDCDGMIDEDFDLDTNPARCGRCDRACPEVPNSAPGCEGGECTPTCEAGFGDCDDDYLTGCEVDLTSPDDCAACNIACADGQFCSASGCVSDCPGTEEVCGRSCIDTDTSLLHCGGCDTPCPEVANAMRTCVGGSCGFVCLSGFDDCDGQEANGCETDLSTVLDCGACDTTCSYPNGMPACGAAGCELGGCNGGFADCTAEPGCESDLTTRATCGNCATTCDDLPNAVVFCAAAGCDFVCNAGFEDCNGMASDGCEANLGSDATCGSCAVSCSGATPVCSGGSCATGCMGGETRCGGSCVDTRTNTSHCGMCGNMCSTPPGATSTCTSSSCGFTCQMGFADCTGGPADGCETSTTTVMNCGGCGQPCNIMNGTGTCSTGSCAVASCNTGFQNCNGIPGDGCETDLRTVMNCGACNNACSLPHAVPVCSGGSCAIGSCNQGFGNCNGLVSDGCEATLNSYYRDVDGDGFGDASSMPMQFCPMGVPTGWVPNNSDCDDNDPNTNPAAMERCDSGGRDENCNGTNNEGFPVGQACFCQTGSAPGMLRCDSTVPSMVSCAYPNEVCNGIDDNCEGRPDETFTCALNSTRSCTIVMGGCTAVGVEACKPGCTGWDACVVSEVCDRADNTCDNFVDENVLGPGSPITIDMTSITGPRTAYSDIRREIGVAYRRNMGTTYETWFVRLDTLGNVLGPPVFVAPSYAFALDIAWDGTHWTIIADNPAGDRLRSFRIEAGTDRVYPGVSISPSISPGNGFAEAALDRVASSSELALAWAESGSARARVVRISAPPSAPTVASQIGAPVDGFGGLGGFGSGVAVQNYSGGAYVFFLRNTPPTVELRWTNVMPGSIGPSMGTGSSPDDAFNLDVALDPASRLMGVLFGRRGATGEFRAFHLFDPTAMALQPSINLPIAEPTYIAAANDGTFAIGTRSGAVRRYRVTDRAAYPDSYSVPNGLRAIAGVSSGTGRYVTLTEGTMLSTAIDCR